MIIKMDTMKKTGDLQSQSEQTVGQLRSQVESRFVQSNIVFTIGSLEQVNVFRITKTCDKTTDRSKNVRTHFMSNHF